MNNAPSCPRLGPGPGRPWWRAPCKRGTGGLVQVQSALPSPLSSRAEIPGIRRSWDPCGRNPGGCCLPIYPAALCPPWGSGHRAGRPLCPENPVCYLKCRPLEHLESRWALRPEGDFWIRSGKAPLGHWVFGAPPCWEKSSQASRAAWGRPSG